MRKDIAILLASCAVAVFASGCGDPVVGSWRAETSTACGITGSDTTDFEILGDLTGSGSVCNCDFDFVLTPHDNGVYDADIDYHDCLFADGHAECSLSSSGESLDCGNLGQYSRND